MEATRWLRRKSEQHDRKRGESSSSAEEERAELRSAATQRTSVGNWSDCSISIRVNLELFTGERPTLYLDHHT